MNSTKTLWIAVVVVAIISVISLFTSHSSTSVKGIATQSVTTNLPSLGVNILKTGPGCDQQYTQGACAGLYLQGGTDATTSAASATLLPSDMGYAFIQDTPTKPGITLTLPASTTAPMSSFLPNTGDQTSFVIFNASSSAASTITIAAGTGMLLEVASSTGTTVSPATVGPLRGTELDCFRSPTTDLVCMLSPFI